MENKLNNKIINAPFLIKPAHTIKEGTLPKSTTRVTMGFSSETKVLKTIHELEHQALVDAQQGKSTRIDRAVAKANQARDKAKKAWDWAHLAHYKALPIADKPRPFIEQLGLRLKHSTLRSKQRKLRPGHPPSPTFTSSCSAPFAAAAFSFSRPFAAAASPLAWPLDLRVSWPAGFLEPPTTVCV